MNVVNIPKVFEIASKLFLPDYPSYAHVFTSLCCHGIMPWIKSFLSNLPTFLHGWLYTRDHLGNFVRNGMNSIHKSKVLAGCITVQNFSSCH